mmetsp:Transcript_73865/g.133133  ORF Transcript_73865/g.133133 Transcript_73865/m.133133 type:complete len:240 (-) Transcript_73865:1365-2084(-)
MTSTHFFSKSTFVTLRLSNLSPTLYVPPIMVKVASLASPQLTHTRPRKTFMTSPRRRSPTFTSSSFRPSDLSQPSTGRFIAACLRVSFSTSTSFLASFSASFTAVSCSFLMMPINQAVGFLMLTEVCDVSTNFDTAAFCTASDSFANLCKPSMFKPSSPNETSLSILATSASMPAFWIKSSRTSPWRRLRSQSRCFCRAEASSTWASCSEPWTASVAPPIRGQTESGIARTLYPEADQT